MNEDNNYETYFIEKWFCLYLCLCAIWVTGQLREEYFILLMVWWWSIDYIRSSLILCWSYLFQNIYSNFKYLFKTNLFSTLSMVWILYFKVICDVLPKNYKEQGIWINDPRQGRFYNFFSNLNLHEAWRKWLNFAFFDCYLLFWNINAGNQFLHLLIKRLLNHLTYLIL